jgi:hypothetical protein
MSKLALFVRYGVEVRVFLNETTREKVRGAILFHTVSDSSYLKEYSSEYEVELIQVSNLEEQQNKWGSFFNSSRMARNRLANRENYKHYTKADNRRRISDYFKGNKIIFSCLKFLFRNSYWNSVNEDLANKLSHNEVNEIWLSGYSSPTNLSVAITATSVNCRTVSYINSWKDYFINDYVPPVFDEIRVWSTAMKEQYASTNKDFKDEQIVVSGNPRLNALYHHTPTQSIEYYRKKYKFSGENLVLYTAINPKAYDDEPKVLELILEKMNYLLGDQPPFFLIKTNPMDSSPERWDKLKRFENVAVIRSKWEWSLQEDFNLPSLASELEWFDLLHLCSCTMNVASTVTVESLVCGKAVINIEFDHTDKIKDLFQRYSNAPFYRFLLTRKDVTLAVDVNQACSSYLNNLKICAGNNLSNLIEFK